MGYGGLALVCLMCAFAGCIRVPPPDASPPVPLAQAADAVPPAGAFVTVIGTARDGDGDADEDEAGQAYLGKACLLMSAERNTAVPGYLRALLSCDGEEVLFRAVVLGVITKLAKTRRLHAGLPVTIADIGQGDVYYDERARFIGTVCTTVALQRSIDRYYQGTLKCFGMPYRFAYVALSAAATPASP